MASGEKNLRYLLGYARELRVESVVREYTEVMLWSAPRRN